MFEIDLLRGQCRPRRRTTLETALIAAAFVVPAAAVIALVALYISQGIALGVADEQIARCDRLIAEKADAMKRVQEAQTKRAELARYDNEINKVRSRCLAWSPVLVEIAKTLPGEAVVHELSLSRNASETELSYKLNLRAYFTGGATTENTRFVDNMNSLKSTRHLVSSARQSSQADSGSVFQSRPGKDCNIDLTVKVR
jgi:Tfp pilus assembly protein PilN